MRRSSAPPQDALHLTTTGHNVKAPPLPVLALSYLAFISLGLPDTVIGVAWPSIRDRFGLSQAGLGVVLTVGVAGYVLSSVVAGRLVVALGVGRLLAASCALVALGLTGYASAPRWAVFVPMAAVIGLGSGAIDAALNGWAARHIPVRHVNWLHACWGVGATAGPAIMTAVLARGASYRFGYVLLACALGAMGLAFAATRRAWEDNGATASSGMALHAGAGEALHSGRVLLQIALFFVYTGLEAGTGQWCFTVLHEGRGLDVEGAGAWTAVYWGSILAGRVVLGFMVDRVGPDRLLRGATVTALAGAALFASNGGLPGRLGLVVLGASLAPMYPTLMSRTPDRVGHHLAPHAVGFQVGAATLGSAAVPAFLGVLAAGVGLGAIGGAVAGVALILLVLHEALVAKTRIAIVRELPKRSLP
jgi:fucose permease